MKTGMILIGGAPHVIEGKFDLAHLQSVVGGLIEVIDLGEGIDLIVCEEPDDDAPPSLIVEIEDDPLLHVVAMTLGRVEDVIVSVRGPVVFLAHDGDGNTVSLSREQIARVRERVGHCGYNYQNDDGDTVAVPAFKRASFRAGL